MASRDDSRGFVFSEMKLNLRLIWGWCSGIDAPLNSMPSERVCTVYLVSCRYTSSLIYFCELLAFKSLNPYGMAADITVNDTLKLSYTLIPVYPHKLMFLLMPIMNM